MLKNYFKTIFSIMLSYKERDIIKKRTSKFDVRKWNSLRTLPNIPAIQDRNRLERTDTGVFWSSISIG